MVEKHRGEMRVICGDSPWFDWVPQQLVPFTNSFGGRVPLLKIDYGKKGTLILTSLLEDLVDMKHAEDPF